MCDVGTIRGDYCKGTSSSLKYLSSLSKLAYIIQNYKVFIRYSPPLID